MYTDVQNIIYFTVCIILGVFNDFNLAERTAAEFFFPGFSQNEIVDPGKSHRI